MSALQLLSLACITLGVAAILRFMWLDSLRFADQGVEATGPARVRPGTAQRLAQHAEAARVIDEAESLPRAA